MLAAWAELEAARARALGSDERREARAVTAAEEALDDALAPSGVDRVVMARREAAWACTQDRARDLEGELGEPDIDAVRAVVDQSEAAWTEVASATDEVEAAGLDDATACLSHKRLILRSYNERVGVLYVEALAAIDRCDPEALLDAQAQLQVAAGRVDQLTTQARSCIETQEPGTAQTVVSVESGLIGTDEDLDPLESPLDGMGEDLGNNPVVADPVSAFE